MSCLNKCQKDNGMATLSVSEGLCLRNCAQKLSTFLPSLRANLQNHPMRDLDEDTVQVKRERGEFSATTVFNIM